MPGRTWQTEPELGLRARPAHFLIFLSDSCQSLAPDAAIVCPSHSWFSNLPRVLPMAQQGLCKPRERTLTPTSFPQESLPTMTAHSSPETCGPSHNGSSRTISGSGCLWDTRTLLLGSDFSEGSFFFSLCPVLSALTPGSFQPVAETPGAPQPQGFQPPFPRLISPVCAFHQMLSCPECQLT